MLFEVPSAVVCESRPTFKDSTCGWPCPLPCRPLGVPKPSRPLPWLLHAPPATEVLPALLAPGTQLWASPLLWPLPGLRYPPLLPWFFQGQLFSITLQVVSSQKCFLTVLSRRTTLLFSLLAPCYYSLTAFIKI